MTQAEKKIDESVIEGVKKGDLACFDIMYRYYSIRLYSFILQILKNKFDTEGIVQDTFMKIWEQREKLDTCSSLDSYLFTIAYNKTVSLLRKRLSERKYVDYLISIQNSDINTGETDNTELLEFSYRISILTEKLPDRQKEVFKLHRIKGLTYKQIAEILNISVNTVENHMVKALKYLRQNLNRDAF
ncbi:MAG: RNA polymerase sigma-70 factor [Prolixibacteraceae bacterium]|nr:RNA polymerase sigma-70 factor [Prolixibacteraceae bacterium]